MKAEESQSIYRMHEPCIKTEFGDRVMTEIGVIKGLEIDDTVNYVLIPCKVKGKTKSWHIHRITKESTTEVESWKDLDKIRKKVGGSS